ncbi:MAG: hypothetical protein QY309_04635 [Cyclobacteriaceae bacterium]|nr:MAG: hypothetical protein QY309_04635 [Cyclobacteriaceae bacterium]
MNANRIITTLATIKGQLQRKQYCSPEQLRVLRKARAKWQKRLDNLINTPTPASQVKKHTPQLPLGLALVLGVLMLACQPKSKVTTPDTLSDAELVATIQHSKQDHATRIYKIKSTNCFVSITNNRSSISCPCQ